MDPEHKRRKLVLRENIDPNCRMFIVRLHLLDDFKDLGITVSAAFYEWINALPGHAFESSVWSRAKIVAPDPGMVPPLSTTCFKRPVELS